MTPRIPSFLVALALPFALLHGRSVDPTPRELVLRAATLMGGADALRGIRTRSARGTELVTINFLQEDWQGAPKSQASYPVSEWIDWRGGRVRASRPLRQGTRSAAPAGPGASAAPGASSSESGPAVEPMWTFVATPEGGGMRADTSWLGAPDAVVEQERRLMLLGSPDGLLRLALDSLDRVTSAGARTYRGRAVQGVVIPVAGQPARLWFDAAEGYPVLVDWISDGVAGVSGEVIVEFGFWSDFGTLRLPRVRRTSINGEVMRVWQVSTIRHDVQLDDSLFAIPASRRTEASVPLTVAELAPGVYRVSGTTHSSLAVRQGGEFFLLEAPVSRRHTQAVLDTLRGRFPRVPVRRALVSHHHGDHASGAPAVLDRGIVTMVPAGQADFISRLGTRWDAGTPATRRVVSVQEERTIGSGATRVVVAPIPTKHVWGLLVAYLPEAGILFEADLQNSGQGTLTELRDFVGSKGWTVRQVAGVHGPLVSWEEFLRAIK